MLVRVGLWLNGIILPTMYFNVRARNIYIYIRSNTPFNVRTTVAWRTIRNDRGALVQRDSYSNMKNTQYIVYSIFKRIAFLRYCLLLETQKNTTMIDKKMRKRILSFYFQS